MLLMLLVIADYDFTDMQNGSLAATGNGKVLSVDGNGDVVLVNDQGAGTLSICSTPGFAINYKNRQPMKFVVPMFMKKVHRQSRVGIGTTTLNAQLSVERTATASGNLYTTFSKAIGATTAN